MGPLTGVDNICRHVVDFYGDDAQMARRVAEHLAGGHSRGEVMVMVVTPAHRVQIERELGRFGIDAAKAASSGTLVHSDAGETLARLMSGGRLDQARFYSVVGGLMESVVGTGARACAYGEMVQLLWEAGRVNEAIALESLWNELASRFSFSLYCAYRSEATCEDLDAMRAICDLHTDVVGDLPDASRLRWPQETWQTCEAAFSPSPEAARSARHFVAAALSRWNMEALSDSAQLVVTELGTNALRHARSPFTVHLSRTSAKLRISVWASCSEVPEWRDAAPDATSGRGIAVVHALADSWGWDVHAIEGDHAEGGSRRTGKDVWAELST